MENKSPPLAPSRFALQSPLPDESDILSRIASASPAAGDDLASWADKVVFASKALESDVLSEEAAKPSTSLPLAAFKGIVGGYALTARLFRAFHREASQSGRVDLPAFPGANPIYGFASALGYFAAWRNARAAGLARKGVDKSEDGSLEFDGPRWFRKIEASAPSKWRDKVVPLVGIPLTLAGAALAPASWAWVLVEQAKLLRATPRIRASLAACAAKKAQSAAREQDPGLLLEAFGDFVQACSPKREPYGPQALFDARFALAKLSACSFAVERAGEDPDLFLCRSSLLSSWRYDVAFELRRKEPAPLGLTAALSQALFDAEFPLRAFNEACDGGKPVPDAWLSAAKSLAVACAEANRDHFDGQHLDGRRFALLLDSSLRTRVDESSDSAGPSPNLSLANRDSLAAFALALPLFMASEGQSNLVEALVERVLADPPTDRDDFVGSERRLQEMCSLLSEAGASWEPFAGLALGVGRHERSEFGLPSLAEEDDFFERTRAFVAEQAEKAIYGASGPVSSRAERPSL